MFDEDLRRRDEQQARQQELRESEAKRLGRRATDGEDVRVPGRMLAKWPAFARWAEEAPITGHEVDGMKDVPLYSSVTNSLFAHLRRPTDEEDADWNKRDGPSTFWMPSYSWYLKPHQRSSNALKAVQYMIYNDLNSSPMLRSSYSLLPYLMFSPYSPYRLVESLSNSPQYWERDTFSYIDAFEDLIRTTQPRKKPLLISQLFGNGLTIHYPDSDLLLVDPATRANAYYSQICHLHHSNLLQESEVLPVPRLETLFPSSKDMAQESATDRRPISKDAQTEQEMYEHFLRWASQPNEKVETAVAEAKAAFAKELESGEVPNVFRTLNKILGSKGVQELFQELDPEDDWRKHRDAQQKAEFDKSPQDPEKVISESTTTQRVKQSDGSVRTCVRVWKLFADGREETTSSSHMEEAERDEDEIFKPLVSIAEDSNPGFEKAKAEKKAETKEASKKGWFWN